MILSMATDIQKLKDDATRTDVNVSELLRRTKILASELGDKNFLKWVENELSGYDSKEAPAYRLITGEPKGFNPYRGWIPVIFTNDEETQRTLSKQRLGQSVSELENLVSSSDGTLQMVYPPVAQKTLSEALGMSTQYAMIFPSSRVVAVLDTIRNKVLDWLIEVGNSGKTKTSTTPDNVETIFPDELISKLPSDLKLLADDFNFNFCNGRPNASMLILRRILPLAIVRRYQKDGKESDIKDSKGKYLETKGLLGKAQSLLNQGRIYTDLISYKVLTDGAQHSYTLNVHLPDARGAGIAARVFLDDIF